MPTSSPARLLPTTRPRHLPTVRPGVYRPGQALHAGPARPLARVLVVEDDPDLAAVLAYLVDREGHAVATAGDGVEALHRFRVEAPDLVLLDLQLPRLSGLEVCRQIRAAGPTPILCLSGLADDDTRHQALVMGADHFVLKPFSVRELTARLRALLTAPPPA